MPELRWEEIRIFVSSTFNDMHAERDYLIQEVFPELRDWCEQRNIRMTDIDLRWGVTREDAESGNTIMACLNSIDECRPFFLCFVGQRRGWVPELEKDISEKTLSRYEGLKEKMGRYSITEMEIEHATLAPMAYLTADGPRRPEKSKALFFFRKNPFSEDALNEAQKAIYTNQGTEDQALEDRKLEEMKERIRAEWVPFVYDCRWDREKETEELRFLKDAGKGRLVDFTVQGRPMRDVILEEMKRLIAEELPRHIPVGASDPFENDAQEQELFARTTIFNFTGRKEELERICAFVRDSGGALILTGPEGTGKTALLCRAVSELREEGRRVLFRSAGASSRSMSELDLYLSLGQEAGLFRGTEMEKDPNTVLRDRCITEEFLAKLKDQGLDALIIDGREIHCAVPQGFSLITSSQGSELPEQDTAAERMILHPLEFFSDREQIIDDFLLHTLKKLDAEDKQQIIGAPGAGLPLYLTILLNELKSFGSFADLQAKIESFGETPKSAFCEVLRTLESQYSAVPGLIRAVAGLLSTARDGLDERELCRGAEELGVRDPETEQMLRRLLRQIRPYLFRYGHRYAIRYDALKDAAADLYIEDVKPFRRALAKVYEGSLRAARPSPPDEWNPVHGDRELLYQLEEAGDWSEIRRVMEDPVTFRMMDPTRYGSDYVNGTFSAAPRDSLGFTLDRKRRAGREQAFALADIFLAHADAARREIRKRYAPPLEATCARLKNQEDLTAFFEYRNLYYNFITYGKIAVRHVLSVCDCTPVNDPEIQEVKVACQSFLDRGRETYGDYHMLSLDGAELTGLSH
ncbi:MAG: DUF4062 domain-containing protein, partial [Lachnospiraceae bacterium]|nr:DUF4062 domain-containing protein [Lachnospiraceae bacterium]